MSVLTVLLLAQLAAPARSTLPVLAFPEAGMDDPAAYQGYQTRIYRDAAQNTLQVYLDGREGRVVHILADAENQSIGFSARDGRGAFAPLEWATAGAELASEGKTRSLTYHLRTRASAVRLGWFLLGSMRVERDFQYWRKHRAPLGGPPFALEETGRLVAALAQLPAGERTRHLALLNAPDLATLRRRLQLTMSESRRGDTVVARVAQPSLDGRDTIAIEIAADGRRVGLAQARGVVALRAAGGAPLTFAVRISTSATPLTPLARDEIFTPAFLAYVEATRSAGARGDSAAALSARWLERQVRGVELLVSREKMMAGLPTYATYFGRDMFMTALMMRPIWRGEMSELAIGSALRKLSPAGEVSHEEALGGQAVREGAAEYASLIAQLSGGTSGAAAATRDSILARARTVLATLTRPRENYHMIDDEYQLPILAARWLADSTVLAERKRAFLTDSSDGGGTRLARLLRELALVATQSAPYVARPDATNLIAFPRRDSVHWASASWRDSGAGYANGRYAMDINAIWVPHALESVDRIVAALRGLGFTADSLSRVAPEVMSRGALATYVRDPGALRAAVAVWRGASRHFVVRLSGAAVRERIAARLAAMPNAERAHWRSVLAATRAGDDSLVFHAVALDSAGRPIGVANTDPATGIFLAASDGGGPGGRASAAGASPDDDRVAQLLRDVRLFTRAYPAGLLVEGIGPVVANDAYATPPVWREFVRDPYHGPRVVWGREVNLFLLGLAHRLSAAPDAASGSERAELRRAIETVQRAAEASGFRSELWSYEFRGGKPVPVRYGSGGDVQLWSTTDLVVQYELSRIRQ